MKKIRIVLLVAVLLGFCLLLNGCSSAQEQPDPGSTAQSQTVEPSTGNGGFVPGLLLGVLLGYVGHCTQMYVRRKKRGRVPGRGSSGSGRTAAGRNGGRAASARAGTGAGRANSSQGRHGADTGQRTFRAAQADTHGIVFEENEGMTAYIVDPTAKEPAAGAPAYRRESVYQSGEERRAAQAEQAAQMPYHRAEEPAVTAPTEAALPKKSPKETARSDGGGQTAAAESSPKPAPKQSTPGGAASSSQERQASVKQPDEPEPLPQNLETGIPLQAVFDSFLGSDLYLEPGEGFYCMPDGRLYPDRSTMARLGTPQFFMNSGLLLVFDAEYNGVTYSLAEIRSGALPGAHYRIVGIRRPAVVTGDGGQRYYVQRSGCVVLKQRS